MDERLGLSKRGAIRVLAVCNQGERSIDAVLHLSQLNWAELRKYYSADKRRVIRSALTDLGIATLTPDIDWKPIRYHFFSYRFPFLNYVLNKFRRKWLFSKKERLFVASCLSRLAAYLECEQQPAQQQLVQLRLNLTTAASYLDNRLFGIPELLAVRNVEYYAPPPGKQLCSIHEAINNSE